MSNTAAATEALTDHLLYHGRKPSPSCQRCMDTNINGYVGDTDCAGSRKIVTGSFEKTGGNGAWAKTICPVCNRKVGATRPTQQRPWVLVGLHK